MNPFVAWPAPCLPAILEGDQSLTLLVSAGRDREDPAEWGAGLVLVERGGRARRVALVLDSVEPGAGDLVERYAGGLAALPASRRRSWFRLYLRAFEPLTPAAPRTATVYDLVRGDEVLRRNAVGVLTPNRSQLRLAFASDIHVARIWDGLDAAVERHAPDLHAGLLHPGRQLDRFVAEANRLAAAGELDLVVFGGDLVDHVHDEPRGGAAGGANVGLFAAAAARLEVPAVAIPGNHDFRLHPWRPRLPRLDSVGLPRSRTRAVLRAAGLWDRWPLRPSDRDALATEDENGDSALVHHLRELAPATDFALQIRGMRLAFASTGRDVMPRWRELEPPRRWLLPRTLWSSYEHPDSEGLHDSQVHRLAEGLDGAKAAAVFLHAPLLHTGKPARIESCIDRLDPGDGDDLAARVAFERRLLGAGIRRGVLYRNPGPILRAVLAVRGPVAVIAGHIHRGTAAVVDRQSLAVRSTEMAAPAAGEDVLPLFTAPSLGHRRYRPEEAQPPGYLLMRFDAGRLAALEQRALGPPALGAGGPKV